MPDKLRDMQQRFIIRRLWFRDSLPAVEPAPVPGAVTGQAKGKPITLPMVQAMFRTLCRHALKGDNQALRRVIELMLTLEPVARDKAREKEEKDARLREAAREYARLVRAGRDNID
jgi:hypothetical protein